MTSVYAPLEPERLAQLSVLHLAHVGDAVYELLVRTQLARRGACSLAQAHAGAVSFVAAPAQAAAAKQLLPRLTDEERGVYRRGRNARVHGCPSGCTIAEYHAATALEALFGWLWLSGRAARVEELFAAIWEELDHAP